MVVQRLVGLRLIQKTGLTDLRVIDRPIEEFKQDFSFAVHEGDRQTLALLNEGLATVMADGTYRHLHAKWFAAMQLPSEHPIIVGGDRNYPPFQFIDDNGKPAGYNVDLTRAIAREMGLDIEIRLGRWQERVQALEDGTIDVLQGMFYSTTRDLTFDFTQPHTVSHYVAVVRKGEGEAPSSVAELQGKKIIVEEGDILHDFAVENGLDNELVAVADQEEALRRLAAGEYDCALVSLVVALYLSEKHGWTHLVAGKKPLLAAEYGYAASTGGKALLANFSEGLKALEESGEYRRIHDKWLGVYRTEPVTLLEALKYSAIVLIPLLFVLLSAVIWNRALQRQVAQKTAELQDSLEHIRHLNQVLRAIRDVNQLMVRERDRQRLIEEGVRLLAGSRSYQAALLILTDDHNTPFTWAVEAPVAITEELFRMLDGGVLPSCCVHAREVGGVFLVDQRASVCFDCSIAESCAESQSICAPLLHEGELFGYLAATAEQELVVDAEEQDLFAELAEDLAYALSVMKLEEARREGAAALHESESRFRLFAELAPVGIVIADKEENTLYANPRFTELLGYTLEDIPSVQQWWETAYPDEAFRDQVRRQWQVTIAEARRTGSEITPMERPVTCKDGTVRHIELRVAATGNFNVVVFTDITERKEAEAEHEKLQAQLLQAQKMESVGRLAGGVAHDFNNMLSVILGNAELALDDVGPEVKLRENLQEIDQAAKRSTEITRQLLAFARRQTINPQVLDLNETVEKMLNMLRRLIGEDVDLSWKPGAGGWPVKIDPSQIDQILANLCVNARDAIADVGRVTIETENIRFDEEYCADHPGFVAGEYVLLAVSDDGCGMDNKTLENIFEPFFTTKEVAKGTGLGLAMIYGIVKQNEGFVNVYSEPGKGTTFRVYFARHYEAPISVEKHVVDEIPHGTGETVLVVEDEAAILKLTGRILDNQGYKVLLASNPTEAMAQVRELPGEVDLLITDVVMPEMNGRDLAKKMQADYPKLKVLFMSGYTANVIAHHGVLDAGVQFIQKPFAGRDLARKIREVMGG